MTGVFQVFPSKSLRDKSVQAEQEAASEDGDAVVETLPQTGCADRDRTVRQPADHDRVDDAHAHPTDLREGQWQGKAESQAQLPSRQFRKFGWQGHFFWIL